MTISDQPVLSGLTTRPRLRTPPSSAEFDEAERLIPDLAALVDAGLVVIREQIGGRPRYGVVPELGDAA